MGDGIVTDSNFNHGLLRGLRSFANRLADFVRLAKAAANLAELIAGHDQCAEAKTTAAFDDLGAAIDEDDLFGQSIVVLWFLLPITATAIALLGCCHIN